jgi:phosphoglycolate phosphatase-like HAD superfamily hydrolase
MKKHILLDFDETICDTRGFNSETCFESVKKHYPEVKRQEVYDMQHIVRGRTLVDIYAYIIKNAANIEPEEAFVQQLVLESMEYQNENLHKVPLFEGIKLFLEKLTRSGKYVSLITNRDKDTLIKILDNHNITKYFDNIISCIDLQRLKPDPVAFEIVMDKDVKLKREIERENYIYIGDSDVDKRFAQNAGIDYMIIDQYVNDYLMFKNITNIFA